MRTSAVLVCAVNLLALAAPAAAGINRWTPAGPETGVVCKLAAAPSRPRTLYAGLNTGGVFRSLDRGATWAPARKGLPAQNLLCFLAVDPLVPTTAYAGTERHGVFKTTDGGATWAPINQGLPAVTEFDIIQIIAIVTDPKTSGVVYTAINTGSIYKSTNGGRTWTELPPGAPRDIFLLLHDPVRPGTLYAMGASLPYRLSKTTNGGASWTEIGQGLPSGSFFSDLRIDPRSPNTLFGSINDHGVYKSTDGGRTWTFSSRGLPRTEPFRSVFGGLALEAGRNQPVLYVITTQGLFRSFNSGRSWSLAGPLPNFLSTLEAVAGTLLTGTGQGVFRSEDQGGSWAVSSRGLRAGTIDSLALDPQSHRLFAAERSLGVFWSPDGGASWSKGRIPNSVAEPFVSGGLAVAPGNPSTIYAGFLQGLLKSTDGGRRWTRATDRICRPPVRLVIDPTTPTTLYMTVNGISDCPQGEDHRTCVTFKSVDAGKTLTCIKDGLPDPGTPVVAVDPFAPANLYSLAEERTIYRSTNGGDSWSEGSDLPDATDHLVFDPVTPGLVYSGQHGRIARSEDNGLTWDFLGEGLPDAGIVALLIQKENPDVLYAATRLSGVFKSTDAGITWTPLGPGLEGLAVQAVALDPADPAILYAATNGGGVMKITQRR